jgi:2-dehydro-3-deoxyglucarate aldolase/4-hydroxy-2-oxoheptanedioate aldolase
VNVRNRVKATLRDGGVALGAWVSLTSLLALRTVADAGFDWVLFDTEHGPLSIETVDARIRALKGAAALPIIRVVWNDVNAIKRALDTGAYGVVIPWVTTRDDAENAVQFCRYPPEGVRGVAPGRPAYVWGLSPEEYLVEVNDELRRSSPSTGSTRPSSAPATSPPRWDVAGNPSLPMWCVPWTPW